MKELSIVFLAVIIIIGVFANIDRLINNYYYRKQQKFEKRNPEYIKYLVKYRDLQQELLDIWNSTMPKCRKDVDYCLNEMKYYPKYSEIYQYYESRLDVNRQKIERCKQKYYEKKMQIEKFEEENKEVINNVAW